MSLFDPNEANRSPHQTFPRSTWEPDRGDPEVLPKAPLRRPSFERQAFGGRERGGAQGGELHPDGPGPFPEDFLETEDVEKLPWTRARGDEWTTAEFRGAVLAWLRAFFRAHPDSALIGWDITEGARGKFKSGRMAPRFHYLRIGVVQLVNGERVRHEVGIDFDFAHRTPGFARVRLERDAAPALEAQLVTIV